MTVQEVAAGAGEAAGGEERKEGAYATVVTGPDISPGSALRETEPREVAGVPCATGAIEWDILQGSAQRGMATRAEGAEEIGTMVVEVAPSATSATDLDILPESVARRRIGVTSAMARVTLQGTAVRTRTHATIVMRLDTS